MKFRKLVEALEDERDLLFAASDYKCKLTRYDMEEAADWNMLLEYIKEVYHILMEEFGDNIKMWKFYEDDDSDLINGYKVWLTDGTKHIVEINNDRVDIVEGLELKEEDEPIKFIIMAVDNDGNRLFYNAESNTFVDSHTDATIYDEHDDAIDAWHKIDKKKYKRVFVPNYNPAMFEAVNKPLNEGELEEGRNNPYFTPYGYRDAVKVLNRTAPEYYWHLKEIEMDKGDGVKLARYALKKGMPVKVDVNSDPDYPEFYLKDGISEYHWNDYFYPYGTTTDMSDLLLWDGKMFVTEDIESDEDIKRNHGYRQDNLKDTFEVGDRVAHRWADEYNVGTIKDTREHEGIQYQVEWDYSDGEYVEWLYGDEITHWVDVNESLNENSDYYKHITHIKTEEDGNYPPEESKQEFVKRVTSDSLIQYVADRIEVIDDKYYLIGLHSDMTEVKFLLGTPGSSTAESNVKHILASPYWHISLSLKEVLSNMYSTSTTEDEYETDYRYYVYDSTDNVVSDGFEYDDDAIEFAQENKYPVVKIHNYFRDDDGKLEPDGDPEVIWTAE